MVQHFAQHRRVSDDSTASLSKKQDAGPSSTGRQSYLDVPQLLEARGLVQPDNVASLSTRIRHATVQDLAGPIDWFLSCAGPLFYVVSKDQAQASIQSISHVSMPLGDIVTRIKDPKMTTVAAELAGMASIGVVYAQLGDPATAPPAELADYFYAVAKLGLDVAIEYSPRRAVKICALIAMYNIIVHATVALAYLGE
jgi:hypothetical protein